MLISVVVCTYGRATALDDLLDCLGSQGYSAFEVLIVDGNSEPSPVRDVLDNFVRGAAPLLSVKLVAGPQGLTRQRNMGLRLAKGDLICFLDDDITVASDFLQSIAEFFQRSDFVDVGGMTAYDARNYPAPITLRWRIKKWLGAIPSLNPGETDHLGRAVPVSFLSPYSGVRQVGWLSGFCMVYRRAAVKGLFFDESLPTYGGEDRDFSMRVAEGWRLLMCGDILVEHHYSAHGRASDVRRVYETGFGTGRRFAKNRRHAEDYGTIVQTFLTDLLVDILVFLGRPSRYSFLSTFARIAGFCAGFRSHVSPTKHPVTS